MIELHNQLANLIDDETGHQEQSKRVLGKQSNMYP